MFVNCQLYNKDTIYYINNPLDTTIFTTVKKCLTIHLFCICSVCSFSTYSLGCKISVSCEHCYKVVKDCKLSTFSLLWESSWTVRRLFTELTEQRGSLGDPVVLGEHGRQVHGHHVVRRVTCNHGNIGSLVHSVINVST